jgi:hypothetical protein
MVVLCLSCVPILFNMDTRSVHVSSKLGTHMAIYLYKNIIYMYIYKWMYVYVFVYVPA